MFQRKPDLIVPVRDRRQHKRFLTLKNFRNATIVGVVVFIGISIRSELRNPDPAYYSPLYQRVLPTVQQKQPPVDVVRETPQPVPDEAHADPLLVEPMAREQWLHADTTATGTTATMLPTGPSRAQAAVATGETRVAIVGGSDGVAVVQQTVRRPVLKGGFGRN